MEMFKQFGILADLLYDKIVHLNNDLANFRLYLGIKLLWLLGFTPLTSVNFWYHYRDRSIVLVLKTTIPSPTAGVAVGGDECLYLFYNISFPVWLSF